MKTLKGEVNCGKPAPDGSEGVHCRFGLLPCLRELEADVVVTDHQQQRAAQLVHFQGGLRVEAEH
jgi:hypothetical protein